MFGIKNIYWVLINSAISFVYLFVISKILGKKQIAQLEFIDYAVGISLGSIAAEMATDSDKPFYYYLIAMTIFFFLLALVVAWVGRTLPFFTITTFSLSNHFLFHSPPHRIKKYK